MSAFQITKSPNHQITERREDDGKLKNLEILRIIGCVIIVMIHLFGVRYNDFLDVGIYAMMHELTKNGSVAVDMFFMISGLLFSLKFRNDLPTAEFIKRKFIRLYPALLFLIIISFIASLFGVFEFNIYENLLTMFCLTGTSLSLNCGEIAPIFWYVSAMMWVMLLFTYLLKNFEKKFVDLVITVGVFFSYSALIHATGGVIIGSSKTIAYVLNLGILRAFGGIGLGYIIGEWYKSYRHHAGHPVTPEWQETVCTILEAMCLIFIIRSLVLSQFYFYNQFIYIIVFASTLVLFLLKKGVISRLFESDIFSKVSRYTYSIYITHIFIIRVFRGSLWAHHPEFVRAHPGANIFAVLVLVVLLGVFTYHFVEVPSANFLKKKLLART